MPMSSTMEAPAVLESGNAPQSRRAACSPEAFHALLFVLVVTSALVPILFCLLYHQQAPGTCWAHGSLKGSPAQNPLEMSWDWELRNCNGIVQHQEQYLIIQQSGNYFIYAQLFRERKTEEPFSVKLYKYPNATLNNAVGHEEGTVNFGIAFHLNEGDKLFCQKNHKLDNILLKSQTYWGLFRI